MKVTDEQRSMIASLVINAGDSLDELGIDIPCLCCGPYRLQLAAEIVGGRHANALVNYVYTQLGCGWRDQPEADSFHVDNLEQTYLDRISGLDDLWAMEELWT